MYEIVLKLVKRKRLSYYIYFVKSKIDSRTRMFFILFKIISLNTIGRFSRFLDYKPLKNKH